MARSRNIKPGFFCNDAIAELCALARLLFIGLWLLADRLGRLEDNPKRIRVLLLPYDQCDAESLLAEIASRGFIERYTVQGKRFIQVVNFTRHQNPHCKEAESTIPAPCKSGASTDVAPGFPERAAPLSDSGFLIPDSLSPQPQSSGPGSSGAEDLGRTAERLLFEELQKHRVKIALEDPLLKTWLSTHGHAKVLAAVLQARTAKPDPQPIPRTYLDSVLADQSWQGAARNSSLLMELRIPTDWSESDRGINAAAHVLGLDLIGKDKNSCKQAIRAALHAHAKRRATANQSAPSGLTH